MLKELFDFVRGKEPRQELIDGFDGMLRYAVDMAHQGMHLYWHRPVDEADLNALSRRDVGLNKLERALRKEIILDVSVHPEHSSAPSLTMMSLVKDVERLGDYAKNLSGLSRLNPTWPDRDPLCNELRAASRELDAFLHQLPDAVRLGDRDGAINLTRVGRTRQKAFTNLIPRIAAGPHAADVTTSLSLAAHYHKRLQGHALNVLSSLIMPLHKLDYFDEDVLDRCANDS